MSEMHNEDGYLFCLYGNQGIIRTIDIRTGTCTREFKAGNSYSVSTIGSL